jgi:hypothetical protein
MIRDSLSNFIIFTVGFTHREAVTSLLVITSVQQTK